MTLYPVFYRGVDKQCGDAIKAVGGTHFFQYRRSAYLSFPARSGNQFLFSVQGSAAVSPENIQVRILIQDSQSPDKGFIACQFHTKHTTSTKYTQTSEASKSTKY
jgi:hypothetical protein